MTHTGVTHTQHVCAHVQMSAKNTIYLSHEIHNGYNIHLVRLHQFTGVTHVVLVRVLPIVISSASVHKHE